MIERSINRVVCEARALPDELHPQSMSLTRGYRGSSVVLSVAGGGNDVGLRRPVTESVVPSLRWL